MGDEEYNMGKVTDKAADKAAEEAEESVIREEFQKAAARTEQETEDSDEETISNARQQELRGRLDAEIQKYEAEKVYAQLSKEDREAMELGRKMLRAKSETGEAEAESAKAGETESRGMVRRAVRRKRMGAYGVLAAVLIMALAMGVTSMGGPERVVEMVKSAVGQREVTKVTSGENKEESVKVTEEDAYQKIKDEFGTEPVRIVSRPSDMAFQKLEWDESWQTAELIYEYNGNQINFFINASYSDSSWGADVEDEKVRKETIIIQDIEIEMGSYRVTDNSKERYSAQFEYKGVEYYLVGTMKRDDFMNILNNLHFL